MQTQTIKELNIYNPVKSNLKFKGKNQKRNVSKETFLEQLLLFPLWKVLYQRYGFNRSLSFFFCMCLGFSPFFIYKEIRFTISLYKFSIFLDENKNLFDYELRKGIILNIIFMNEIMCYKGSRHRNNYPTRGQRTRSNFKNSRKHNKNYKIR